MDERAEQQAASRGLLARVLGFFRSLFAPGRPAPTVPEPVPPAEDAGELGARDLPSKKEPDAEAHPREAEDQAAPPEPLPIPKERPPGVGPKYAPLYHHLSTVEGNVWKTNFAEIREILGNPLPRSALIYPAWWANTGKSQSNAWLAAGWSTQEVNLHSATLTFFRSGGLPKAATDAADAGDDESGETTTNEGAPASPLLSGEEGRTEADRIRLFTFATVIAPARNANQQTVTVRAGDLHKEMGLQNRYASVVNALRGRKFAALADVTIVHQEGARVGASTQFTFALTDAAGEQAAPVVEPPTAELAWPEPPRQEPSVRDLPSKQEPASTAAQSKVADQVRQDALPPKESSVTVEAPQASTPTGAGTAAASPPLQTYSGPARTVVIVQGGEDKAADAGHMVLADGRRVVFVAEPGVAPSDPGMAYRRPDDRADGIQTFRDALVAYNATPEDNPLALLPAWRLYEDDAYRALAEGVGAENVFILSAGWGLIESNFLTPTYDITFSNGVATYKRRRPRDSYNDLRRLPSEGTSRIVFAGGADYIPLFLELTEGITAERIVYHHASRVPLAANAQFVPVESDDTNDWHLQWARDYAAGKVSPP